MTHARSLPAIAETDTIHRMGFQKSAGLIPGGIGHYRPTSYPSFPARPSGFSTTLPHFPLHVQSAPPTVTNRSRSRSLSSLRRTFCRSPHTGIPLPQSENDATCASAEPPAMTLRVRHCCAAAAAATDAMSNSQRAPQQRPKVRT